MELELTEWTPENASARVPLLNDPAVYRFLAPTLPLPYTLQDSLDFLEACSETNMREFAVVVDGAAVGSIGGSFSDDGREFEMGYYLAPSHHRRGIMSRAIKIFTSRLAELNPQLERIKAKVYDFNPASQALLLHCGFTRVPHVEFLEARDGLEHQLFLYELRSKN